MPRYKSGRRPDLDALIAEKAGVGAVFSTQEAESHGISRQMLSYYEKHGRLNRLRHGVYKSALFPSSPNDYIVGANVAAAGTAVAGPSALTLQRVGHLESENVWLRPTHGHRITSKPEGTLLVGPPASSKQLVDLGGVKAENVAEAINTASATGIYDADQIEEVRKEAKDKGLI